MSHSFTNCTLIGHSIDAITTAVVLVSIGGKVQLHADVTKLEKILKQYSFEQDVIALWQMYVTNGDITVNSLSIIRTMKAFAVEQKNSICWLFHDDVVDATLTLNNGQADTWLDAFVLATNSSVQQSTSVIITGKQPMNYFDCLGKRIHHPWVYYIPFVFLKDGQAYHSMMNAPLLLIGEKTENSWHRLTLLQPLQKRANESYIKDIATIEFARSSIMGMLATRVSFMNEMSRLADAYQVDISTISTIMGLDKRIGSSYLQAGWGFGGQTLPLELAALSNSFANVNTETKLVLSVQDINKDQKELIFRKFWQYFDGVIEGKTVLIWGGGYKPGSGRTEGSSIHPLLALLWSFGIDTMVCAGQATAELQNLYADEKKLSFTDDAYESLEKPHAIFIITWDYQKLPDIGKLNEVAVPIFDTQNIFTQAQMASLKSGYFGIGRGELID